MDNVNTGHRNKQQDQAALKNLVDEKTSAKDTKLVEREGKKFLVRKLSNGMTIETRIA